MKHIRTYSSGRPALDATPELPCNRTPNALGSMVCVGLCPRHDPAAWSEHMARHATDTIPFTGERDVRMIACVPDCEFGDECVEPTGEVCFYCKHERFPQDEPFRIVTECGTLVLSCVGCGNPSSPLAAER